jgi:hypothetical protein
MKRLLKFATILLVTVTFLMPLLECFDRWDKPGLTNDTEFPVFLVVLFVALVLLAVGAMARRALDRQGNTVEGYILYEPFVVLLDAWTDIVVAPFVSPPLRI